MENIIETQDINISGVIKFIKYDADMFQTFVFKNDELGSFNCRSNFPIETIHVFDKLILTGHWIDDERYGRQFEVLAKKVEVPQSIEGIKKYLEKHINGVGPALAERIVDMFDVSTWEIIENNPEELCKVNGISIIKARKIAADYTAKVGTRDDIIWFNKHLINNAGYISEIKKKYGHEYKEIIEKNPYRLSNDISGIGFKKADLIARTFGFEVDSPFRIAAGIRAALVNAQDFGNVYLTQEELLTKSNSLLEISFDKISKILEHLLEKDEAKRNNDPICFIQLIKENEAIYDEKMYKEEKFIAEYLKKQTNAILPEAKLNSKDIESALNKIVKKESNGSFELDISQRNAAVNSIKNSVSIITGGPGTGKTTTLNTIIKYLEQKCGFKEEDFCLLAPTGKAAKRMSEQTNMFATTIHKAVGYGSQRKSIEASVVIVDEMSMTDMHVMAMLLRSFEETVKRVIFVGDSDQLPSVGPGNILKDMIESKAIPLSRLNVIHRQAETSGIIKYSQAIINETMFPENPDMDDFIFINNANVNTVEEQVIDMYTTGIPEWLKENGLNSSSIQILCPFKDPARQLSSGSFNNLIQRKNAELNKNECISFYKDRIIYYVGDKVIHTKNDYDMKRQSPSGKISSGVMNGETGTVIEVDNKLKLMTVKYDDGDIGVYSKDNIAELNLAYALTVHKSQGAEYQAVIIPIVSGGMSSIMNKNLLYTAVTRAKKMVIVIGAKNVIARMVHTKYSEKRNTKLCDRLMGV